MRKNRISGNALSYSASSSSFSLAVAVSGGADSLYALASLAASGHGVLALHARFLPPDLIPDGYEAMLERLAASCDGLNLPLRVADCASAFTAAVIDPFVRAYAAGLTPNPCATCNATMKFGLLLDEAEKLGALRLATGHYARLEQTADGPALYAGADAAKDQSYFLSLTPPGRLARAVFPLAARRKNEVRAYLAARGLPVPAPAESQEICFVPGDEYRSFVRERAKRLGLALPGPGPVRLTDGRVVGEHRGLWQYTEGQRRGLGIAWSEPLYVLRKDMPSNTLLVGAGQEDTQGPVLAAHVNYLLPFNKWPDELLIRTRYRQNPREASAELCADGALLLREKDSGGPCAKGQLATVYGRETPDGASRLRVLAGGIIS